MKDLYFKLIGLKSSENKMIIFAVVPTDLFGDVPDIFEVQSVKIAPNIYSGTYPNIRVISESIKDRTEELRGMGVEAIITSEGWYNKEVIKNDPFGIAIK